MGPASHLFSDGRCKRRSCIQWTSALDASLLAINSSCGAPGSKGRMARLMEKWSEVHLDMPTTSGALHERLLRIRSKHLVQPPRDPPSEGAGQLQPVSAVPSQITLEEDTPAQSAVLVEGMQLSAPSAVPLVSSQTLIDKRPLSAAEEREGDRARPSSDAEISSEVLDELREEYQNVLREVEAVVEGNISARVRPSCQGIRVNGGLLLAVDDLIPRKWEVCSERTLWKLTCLVYAGAVVVEKFVKRSLVRPGGGGCPRVESIRRREAEVTELIRKIGWLMSKISRRKTSPKITDRLYRNQARVCRIFGTQSLRELEARLETLKGYLSVHCLQLRRLKKTLRHKRLNIAVSPSGPKSWRSKMGLPLCSLLNPPPIKSLSIGMVCLGSQVPILGKTLLSVDGRKRFERFPLQPGRSSTLQFGCQL